MRRLVIKSIALWAVFYCVVSITYMVLIVGL